MDANAAVGERLNGIVGEGRGIVRPKFVRKVVITPDPFAEDDGEPEPPTVMIAEPPEKPIERGLAGPGLLAMTIVQRWQDHLPAHRQEAIWARDGLELSRSTICSWHQQLADLDERTRPIDCVS